MFCSGPNLSRNWTIPYIKDNLPQLVADLNASSKGVWSVIGLSGCIAIHASFSHLNRILFFERPHRYGHRLVQNPYLTVSIHAEPIM